MHSAVPAATRSLHCGRATRRGCRGPGLVGCRCGELTPGWFWAIHRRGPDCSQKGVEGCENRHRDHRDSGSRENQIAAASEIPLAWPPRSTSPERPADCSIILLVCRSTPPARPDTGNSSPSGLGLQCAVSVAVSEAAPATVPATILAVAVPVQGAALAYPDVPFAVTSCHGGGWWLSSRCRDRMVRLPISPLRKPVQRPTHTSWLSRDRTFLRCVCRCGRPRSAGRTPLCDSTRRSLATTVGPDVQTREAIQWIELSWSVSHQPTGELLGLLSDNGCKSECWDRYAAVAQGIRVPHSLKYCRYAPPAVGHEFFAVC